MEFPLRSAQIQAVLEAGKPLLSGQRTIACMGDLLTLEVVQSFSDDQ